MRETYALHQQGLSIEEIARERRCTTGTIEGHLIECVRAGYAVDIVGSTRTHWQPNIAFELLNPVAFGS